MFIKIKGKGLIKIDISNVTYISADNDYVLFHQNGKEPIRARMSMKEVEDALEVNYFYRVHRSYLVNLNYISHIKSNVILMEDAQIPISRARRKDLIEALATY